MGEGFGYVPEQKMGTGTADPIPHAVASCYCWLCRPSEQTSRAEAAEPPNGKRAGGKCSDAFLPIPGVTVIGLGHKARHGKDTAARILMDSFEGVQRFSFADDLYAVARVLHGMTTKDAPLLQRVGVEMREKDENVWVRSVYAKILAEKPRVAVISDVRFPNEMAFVKALGGVCWKMTRIVNGERYTDPSRPADHISETALDKADWDSEIICSNLADLQTAVRDQFIIHVAKPKLVFQ